MSAQPTLFNTRLMATNKAMKDLQRERDVYFSQAKKAILDKKIAFPMAKPMPTPEPDPEFHIADETRKYTLRVFDNPCPQCGSTTAIMVREFPAPKAKPTYQLICADIIECKFAMDKQRYSKDAIRIWKMNSLLSKAP